MTQPGRPLRPGRQSWLSACSPSRVSSSSWSTLGTVGLLLVGISLGGCGQSSTKQTLTFGALLPMTGTLGGYGVPQTVAIQLAMADINEAGGVLGKPLDLVTSDDGSDKTRAKAAAQPLLDAGVPVVIGSIASGVTMAAAELLADAGVVQISTDSTSPLISTFADQGYLFRTCPSDAFQGKLLAQRARDNGGSTAALVFVPGPYGEGLADAFEREFTASDGGTVVFRRAYVENQDSYAALVAELVGANPNVVLLAGYPAESAKIVSTYATTYPGRSTRWYLGDAIGNGDFVTAAGGAATFAFPHEGATFAAPSGDTWDAFVSSYRAKAGAEASLGFAIGNAYDAVVMAALAIERAQSASPAKIRDALLQLKGGPKHTPATLREALSAARTGQNVEYTGVSGPIVFDANGDITAARYNIWAVEAGAIVTKVAHVTPR